MALTGLDIYKKLPKENCKECGVPTCLAFAMKVASGQESLDKCPKLDEAAMGDLSDASAPPQRLIKIGGEANTIEIGQETVLYRHDEKFHHPTAIAMQLSDASDVPGACEAFKKLVFHRVGEDIQPDMIALVNDSGSADTFASAAAAINDALDVPMVLISSDVSALSAAAGGPLAGARPVLYYTGAAGDEGLADLASNAKMPLCVSGSLDDVAAATEALAKAGVADMLISPGSVGADEGLTFVTKARRAALKKTFRPLGYPALVLACGEDKTAAALDALTYICKYAGVLVTDAWEPHLLVPILAARQNIYTDPQKPVQVEPRVYEVGDVTADSPLLVTTNFSLSYYSVESEVEASRVPCRILAVDTEGTSVLTAWAADKFNPETIAEALTAAGLDSTLSHHKIVIPGHVAVLSAQLADDSGWEVLVGPREASGLGPYLKNDWKAA
ncbi:MAG: acetyl-CoA decarbonylase/synthase complex subunit gamma [Phycisphaerae bacterium]|jgi:acetyl-CoA decarbonylase/synthase complex subunit gamma|nr:acetyl-CoA decarbonylase/synthase complex subunit gamma [Phycisphaerae bacterium]MDP7286485.1 acetyl-CoA decarbonylase/synthase complex subunit gamma [Phycisphaerae bacterium]